MYRARVAECAEAVDAVVIAHPRRPDPAKGQILHRIVEQDVVDRHPARYGAGEYALLLALVLSEIIEAERAVVGVHIVAGVVDAAIGADRQHGPEYLFMHPLHLAGAAADAVDRKSVV